MRAEQARGGKQSVDWAGFQVLPDGFYLPWKKPGQFANGYMWFSRKLGHLVAEPGQTSNWRVVGHPEGYDHANVAQPQPSGILPKASATMPEASPPPSANTAKASVSSPGSGSMPSVFAAASASSAGGGGAALPAPSCACPVLLLSARRQELEKRRHAYVLGNLLGQGNFGRCFRARREVDGMEVAVKELRQGPDQLRHAWAEAYLLDRCRGNPFFPQLLDVIMTSGQYNLVMDYCGPDLHEYLKTRGGALAPEETRCVTQHTASALQFLHGLGLLHGDVKPQNIFVHRPAAGNLAAKLGDLGSATEAGR